MFPGMTCRRVRLRGCRPRDRDGFTPRKEFLSAVRERYGLREPVGSLMRGFREQIVALVEPDPQVPAVLDRLRVAGWRIAIEPTAPPPNSGPRSAALVWTATSMQ